MAVRGEPCYFTLTARDAWGNACGGGGHALSARLRPPLTDRRQPQLFLRDLADGTVEASFTPVAKGAHLIACFLGADPVRGVISRWWWNRMSGEARWQRPSRRHKATSRARGRRHWPSQKSSRTRKSVGPDPPPQLLICTTSPTESRATGTSYPPSTMGAEASTESRCRGRRAGGRLGEYMQQVMEEHQIAAAVASAGACPSDGAATAPGSRARGRRARRPRTSARRGAPPRDGADGRPPAPPRGGGGGGPRRDALLEPPAALVPLVAPGAGRDGRALPAKKRPRLNQYNSQESVSSNESAPAYRSLAGEPPALDRYASTAPPSRRGSYAGGVRRRRGAVGRIRRVGGRTTAVRRAAPASSASGPPRRAPPPRRRRAAAPGTPLQKGTSSEALSATMEEALHQAYAGGTPSARRGGGAAAAGGPGSAAAADDEVDDDAHAAAALARRAQDLYAEQQAQAAAAAQAPAAASRQQFRCSQCGASHNGHHVCPYADQYALRLRRRPRLGGERRDDDGVLRRRARRPARRLLRRRQLSTNVESQRSCGPAPKTRSSCRGWRRSGTSGGGWRRCSPTARTTPCATGGTGWRRRGSTRSSTSPSPTAPPPSPPSGPPPASPARGRPPTSPPPSPR